MKPSEALEMNRDAIRTAARRYRTANPRAFGSALHGDDQEGSDNMRMAITTPTFTSSGEQSELTYRLYSDASNLFIRRPERR